MQTQKYIEDEKIIYEVDDFFVEKIRELPQRLAFYIAKQIDNSAEDLPKLNSWTQKVGGVYTKGDEPVYYEVEFLNEYGTVPLFVDVELIDSDDYLDYYIENLILNFNENTSKAKGQEGVS
jgi:hypothetical protein|tara:strand:+ start:808 stop:1170 length:363 start_codon:yes stop_codon:yes gene_type:complete